MKGFSFLTVLIILVSWVAVVLSSSVKVRELATIGRIQSVLAYKGDLLVTTQENILSLVSEKTGELLWRMVLPSTEVVDKVVLFQSEVYVLSTVTSKHREALGLVRKISADLGTVVWDASLPKLSQKGSVEAVDLLFNQQDNTLVVLFRGEVHLLSSLDSSPTIWTPSADLASKSPVEFFQLLTPSEISSLSTVAAGCVLDDQSRCVDTFFLKIDEEKKTAALKLAEKAKEASSLEFVQVVQGELVQWDVRRGSKEVTVILRSGTAKKSSGELTWRHEGPKIDIVKALLVRSASQSTQPSLLICSTQANEKKTCGLIIAEQSNGSWKLRIDDEVSQEGDRLPVWSASKAGGPVVDVRFISSQPSSSDLTIAGPQQLLESFRRSTLFSHVPGTILMVSPETGLASLVKEGGLRTYTVPDNVLWARNEGLSEARKAFILSTSPLLAVDESHNKLNANVVRKESQNWQDVLNGLLQVTAGVTLHHHGIAAFLSHKEVSAKSPVNWDDLNLRVHGVALQKGGADWITSLLPPSSAANDQVWKVSTAPIHWQPHSTESNENLEDANDNAILVVVDTLSSGSFLWIVDADRGQVFSSLRYDASSHSHWAEDSSSSLRLGDIELHLSAPTISFPVDLGQLQYVTAARATHNSHSSFSLVYRANDNLLQVRPQTFVGYNESSTTFLHTRDYPLPNALSFFRVTGESCSVVLSTEVSCKVARVVAQNPLAAADGDARLVSTSYVDVNDPVKRDDNLLRKYNNPNLMVACSLWGQNDTLSAYVLDAASGRLIRRFSLEQAAEPVHSLLIENFVLVSYWNPKAKRSELFVAALYEGFIGKHELTPGWKSLPRVLGLDNSEVQDERTAFLQPQLLSVEKVYVLPRAVSHLHYTTSSKGISNKNLLITLDSGEAFSLDLRLVSPRRPLSEPTAAEKEEGLLRYSPYLLLNPVQSLTGPLGMEGTGSLHALTTPSVLESTCTVVLFSLFGSRGIRVLTHVPSGGFDTLATDFNASLLVLLLSGLAVAVLVLRNLYLKNTLRKLWL
eukprot:scaffold1091_cov164-Ochromonas_danica.AAC.40